MTARAVHHSDQTVVIEPLHVARRFDERTRGLLDRTALADAEGLWLPRCRLVHTFGMKFPIDLVYLTESGEICKVVEGLRPARLSACLGAASVIELKSGAARTLGLTRGIRLQIQE